MKPRALVVVFGDVAQSPRMLNHARSLLDAGYRVDLIGYMRGSPDPHCAVDERRHSEEEDLTFHRIPQMRPPAFLPAVLARLFSLVLAVLFKTLVFAWIGLFRVGRPRVLLVQNPPCLPTLLVAPLLAAVHGARYIVDWHNLSHSILAISGSARWLVDLVRRLELALGSLAPLHLTVTEAMKAWLQEHTRIPPASIHVLYDRPNHCFRHLALEEKHRFLTRFFAELDDEAWGDESPATEIDERTGAVRMRPDNARDRALVVSSTSWTADEDFGLLWRAILDCEQQLAKAGPKRTSLFPTIHLVITGRGPQRQYYEDLFRSQRLHFFRIKTLWLAAEDYPKLLACADLGISLHSSSSGLDLPMKIMDMMGCGLPVLAYSYKTLTSELIEDEENGLLFEDGDHLAQQILDLFHGFPKGSKLIKKVAQNLVMKPPMPWKGYWNKVVLEGILKKAA